jgi:hypothetical protein
VTDDLRAFVAARLDEDEAAALAAAEGSWSFVGYDDPGWAIVANDEHEVVSRSGSDDASHIARHDPARVLREVAAKRAIVELHQPNEDGCSLCFLVIDDPAHIGEWEAFPCRTLRQLAAVWSDHPDFDPNWSTT